MKSVDEGVHQETDGRCLKARRHTKLPYLAHRYTKLPDSEELA
jgi:hypothetical protein